MGGLLIGTVMTLWLAPVLYAAWSQPTRARIADSGS